jgi:hypothetical protein
VLSSSGDVPEMRARPVLQPEHSRLGYPPRPSLWSRGRRRSSGYVNRGIARGFAVLPRLMACGFRPPKRKTATPLDVLIIHSVLTSKPIGVLEALQSSKGKKERNDRVFGCRIVLPSRASSRNARATLSQSAIRFPPLNSGICARSGCLQRAPDQPHRPQPARLTRHQALQGLTSPPSNAKIVSQRGTGPRATSCRNTGSSRNARATSSESADPSAYTTRVLLITPSSGGC